MVEQNTTTAAGQALTHAGIALDKSALLARGILTLLEQLAQSEMDREDRACVAAIEALASQIMSIAESAGAAVMSVPVTGSPA